MPRRAGVAPTLFLSPLARCIAGLVLVCVAVVTWPGSGRAQDGAVLRGLDKITARVSSFTAPIDQEIQFGTLRITARTCRKRPPEEQPEVAVFLEIAEERPGEDHRLSLFAGWMFASSPALSALEHPVYDVWVIDCRTSDAESAAPPSEKSAE